MFCSTRHKIVVSLCVGAALTAMFVDYRPLDAIEFQDKPVVAQVCTVGLIANTHAVRHPTPGGFGKSFSLTFIRFLDQGAARTSLRVKYIFLWDTATSADLRSGPELLGGQMVHFPVPGADDLVRGYQTVRRSLEVRANDPLPTGSQAARGKRFRVSLLSMPGGDYNLVDTEGRLVRELNRRHALPEATCTIYEGCVVSCLPNDRASASEQNAVDAQDLDQNVPDCYLIASLIAAARCDPEQLRSLISETRDGYAVTFPGNETLVLPRDVDRGPDMVETTALDVNARGEVEIWPILLERAYAMVQSRLKNGNSELGQEFQHVTGGDAEIAYRILTGRAAIEHTRSEFASRADQVAAIHKHLKTGKPVMFSTGKWTQPGERPEWWKEDHVYVITAIQARFGTITLIDPCGGQFVHSIKLDHWFDSTEVKRFLFCD